MHPAGGGVLWAVVSALAAGANGPAARAEPLLRLAALAEAKAGLLWAVSPETGAPLAVCDLGAAPVLDGMAAMPGRLVLACRDGTVRCLAGRGPAR